MKTLVYTITNFSPNADDCIDLLYKSLALKNDPSDFDFLVVSNVQAPVNFKYSTVIDQSISRDCYVGFLKYSDLVPKNYSQYVYLDSDILYFGKINDLYSNKSISIVRDHGSMASSWFYYKYHDRSDLSLMEKTQAVNGGTFCFKDTSLLSSVKTLYVPHISQNNLIENAMLEQASYNYVVAKLGNFSFDMFHDLTDMSLLYAANKGIVENKNLYHFCGFRNSMIVKYQEMKDLYDKYERTNSTTNT